MFQINRTSPERLDIIIEGSLNSDEMRHALDNLIQESAGMENGKMLYDLVSFELPSLKAIMIEFSRLPAMFSLLGRFKRAAVLTDKSWIKTVSELEGKLIPGLEIKGFTREQRAAAEAWLEQG